MLHTAICQILHKGNCVNLFFPQEHRQLITLWWGRSWKLYTKKQVQRRRTTIRRAPHRHFLASILPKAKRALLCLRPIHSLYMHFHFERRLQHLCVVNSGRSQESKQPVYQYNIILGDEPEIFVIFTSLMILHIYCKNSCASVKKALTSWIIQN